MKPVIDAKQARDDIRSGMSPVALMAKYNLSLKGFQSLVNKLIEAGALTKSELQRLMPEFMKVAQIWAEDTDLLQAASMGLGRKINAFEAVREVRSGLSNADLMKKFGISPKGLENLFEQLVGEGLLLPSELEFRLSALAGAIDAEPVQSKPQKKRSQPKAQEVMWTCPACGRGQPREFEECPVCGVIVAKFKTRPNDQTIKQ